MARLEDKVNAAESLVYLTDGAFERVVFLIAEQCAATELFMQFTDDFHRVFVCSMERLFASSVLNFQLLIIVAVEGVECVCIIDNDIE